MKAELVNLPRGRLAPTPTGHLHLGHAATFIRAHDSIRARGGSLILRIEDLDAQRCRRDYEEAALADLRALGLSWDEGPDLGGPCAPYRQSERHEIFLQAWRQLQQAACIYPCPHSRKDLQLALGAPNEGDDTEPVFPPALRSPIPPPGLEEPGNVNWRFCVPDGRVMLFEDQLMGPQAFTAAVDFGDFLVWRKDGWPSYELAVVADDIAMGVTEVMRGADLLLSTARQLLLYEALQATPPVFAHCPLIRDPATGRRLAKRHQDLALRSMMAAGRNPRTELGL